MSGFTDTQIKKLKANLEERHVKPRKKAGITLHYVEGWHVIAEANRIFGFSEWDRRTELTQLGEPELVKSIKSTNRGDIEVENWHVRYMAKSSITVNAGGRFVTRDGIGYGSGIARNMGDAYEGAIKEAETDAMKRALVTFGNPFGLALYDKDRANVGPNYRSKAECRQDYESMQADIDAADSNDALDILAQAEDWRDRVSTMPEDWQQNLRDRFYEKLKQLKEAASANGPPF